MAVVRDMLTFPLKQNQNIPDPIGSNFNNFPQPVQSQTPAIGSVATDTMPNLPTGNIFGPTQLPADGLDPNQLKPTRLPQSNDDKFRTNTAEFEGDGELKSVVNNTSGEDVSIDSFFARPIYVSSLGELSTDFGDKFDVTKVNIIKPAVNTPISDRTTEKPSETGSRFFINQVQPFGTQVSSDFNATPVNSGEANLLGSLVSQKIGQGQVCINECAFAVRFWSDTSIHWYCRFYRASNFIFDHKFRHHHSNRKQNAGKLLFELIFILISE